MTTHRIASHQTIANCWLVAILLLVALPLRCEASDDFAGRIARAVATWSTGSGVVVTGDTVKALVMQAHTAVEEISQKNASTSKARLEEVAPRAVVSHLERSQSSGRAPPVSDLIEQLATNAGVLLPAVTDFPTLKVTVVPPEPADFVVAINGTEYRGGSTVFRVAATALTVVVSMTGKSICQFKVALKPGDIHTETCSR